MRRLALAGLLAATWCPAAEKPWWEREPLRILDLTTSIGRIDYRDPAELAAQKAANFYNAEHLDIMGMSAGLDDQHFYFVSKVAGKQNPDYLGRYVPEAKKRGVRVLIYFNVHWYTMAFAEKHPDWRQITEGGAPVSGVYETGTDFCVNTPWREWCFQILRDLAAYPIDGIFYDGPIFRADTCYCRYCREKFRTRYGKEIPSKKARQGRAFQELIDFQAASLADYLRDSRRILRSIRPDLALYMNGGVRGANWATARLNRVLVAEQDLLGSEGGFIYGDLTRIPLWKPGLTARLLETQAGGKPTVIFSAASHKPWAFSLLPDPELRLLYAGTIANAASVWFGITPFEWDQPEMKTLAEMNRFLAAKKEYYVETRSEARAAVVWSDTTANFYSGADAQMIDIDRIPQRSEVGNLEAEFSGIAEGLMRALTPFDVIDDTALDREPLGRYAALFLPNVAAMSDAVAARLRDYVRGGGNLFATFETSLYDETGVRRSEFALADVFGVSDGRKIAGPMRWDFIKPIAAGELTTGIERELIPASTYHVRVVPKMARVLWKYAKPLAGRYDGVPDISDDPALVENQFGKGKAVYFSGDFGAMVNGFRVPEYLQLARNAASALAPAQVEFENVPSSVEVVWRSQHGGKRKLLHLVNFTGEMTRPIRQIVPLTNVRVKVSGAAPVKSVHTLVHGEKIKPAVTAGGVEFVVPRVDEYEVVVLE